MRKQGFLIDMDGVIYRGKQLIPGADQFITSLLDRGVPFAFSSQGLTGDSAWEKFRTNLRQVMTAGLSEDAFRAGRRTWRPNRDRAISIGATAALPRVARQYRNSRCK